MSEVSATSQQLRRAVLDCIDPGPVIVACSGGPDSLALVASAAWAVPHSGGSASVVIVDHGLQAGSDVIAQQAAEAAIALGIDDVEVRRVQVGRDGGPEASARSARRQALLEASMHKGGAQILLAHTRDDQAETVLMRIARGSGARSLAAMRSCDPPWHRPFLDIPRELVHRVAREHLEPHGLEAWDDPHNHDPSFTRVRVREAMRTLVSQLGSGFVPGLARSAHLLRDDADALEGWANGAFERTIELREEQCSAPVAALIELPRAVRTRVIRLMHGAMASEGDVLDFDHVQQVETMVSNWKGQGSAKLPGSVTAAIEYERLIFLRRSPGDLSAT